MKFLIALLTILTCAGPAAAQLSGDYDYYRMYVPKEGAFSARRHFGFARFAADTSWLKARSGATMFRITSVTRDQDSIAIQFLSASGAKQEIRGVVRGDTIAGRLLRDTATLSLAWLIKRSTPPAFEPPYSPWQGAASEPKYQVQIDSAVPMKARDGTMLMNLVARPVGEGPFPA